jgi:hypothetical protein
MLRNYTHKKLSRVLLFWGGFLFVVFGVFLVAGKFEIRSGARLVGRRTTLILRHDSPLIYWGTESAILVVAVSLFASGVYRARKDSDGDDA